MSFDWSGVNWHLLHSDDFDTYSSQGDFEAAYPPIIGGTPIPYPTWGLTNGPDGQPGLYGYNHGSNPVHTPGKNLSPTGRFAKVTIRVDNADFLTSLTQLGGLITLWHRTSSFAITSIVEVIANDTGGGILTGAGRSVDPPGSTIFTSGSLSFPRPGPPIDLEMWVAISTKTEGSPGVFASNADGAFEIHIDGVTVYAYEGVVSSRDTGTLADYYWECLGFGPFGHLAALRVYDSEGSPNIPQNNSSECCSSSAVEASGVSSPGAGVKRPALMSAAWGGRCDGGGSVMLLSDLTNAEDWSDS